MLKTPATPSLYNWTQIYTIPNKTFTAINFYETVFYSNPLHSLPQNSWSSKKNFDV